MSVTVRDLRPEDHAAWDAFVRNHPLGSPFHLIAWMRSIEATFGYKPRYLIAAEGGEVRAVLPLFLVSNPLMGKTLLSSPFAVYGGVLAASDADKAAMAAEVDARSRALGVGFTELRNAYPDQAAGFSGVTRYVTFTERIGPDEEAMLEKIPRKVRYMVRKSLKQPFAMRVAESPDTFIDLYTRNLRRLGTPAFPRKHFLNLLRFFGKDVDVREVTLEDKVVSAVMTFYFRDQVLPYYGASDPAYNNVAPNNYMYFELMRWGGRNGYTVFDFGRSKKESGSFDFKAHWGMDMRDLPYEMLLVKRKTLPNYSPNNPKYQAFIRMWQRVPLPVTRAIGPALIKLVP